MNTHLYSPGAGYERAPCPWKQRNEICPYEDKDMCPCVSENKKRYRKKKRDDFVRWNTAFLLKNGIKFQNTRNENVVITYNFHRPLYISLKNLKCRWKNSQNWIQKSKKVRGLDTILREGKYKGLTVAAAIKRAPVYMKKFIEESECFFLPECYFAAGFATDAEADAKRNEIVFWFGKHKGKTVKEVYKFDKGYLLWLISVWDSEKNELYNAMINLFENHPTRKRIGRSV